MANYCRGALRLRGKRKDLQAFLKDRIIEIDYKIVTFESAKMQENEMCNIKETNGFIENRIIFECCEEDDIISMCFNALFENQIDADQLLEICIEYNLDMRIHAFESLRRFNQVVEIIGGEITKNEMIWFDDYVWECIFPELGG